MSSDSESPTNNADKHWAKKFFKENFKSIAESIELSDSRSIVIDKKENKKTRVVSLCGKPIKSLKKQDLQRFCTAANIPGWSRRNKPELVDIIEAYAINEAVYKEQQGRGNQQQQKNAYIRILNIIFMVEAIKGMFARYHEQPTNTDLARKRVANQDMFEAIFDIFNNLPDQNEDEEENNNPVNKLHHDIEGVTGVFDPKDVVPLTSWKEVDTMIKKMNSDFKQIELGWKASGEHRHIADVLDGMAIDIECPEEKKRFKINSGKMLYYFYFLKQNPELLPTVTKPLPDNVKLSSTRGNFVTGENKKKRERDNNLDQMAGTMLKWAANVEEEKGKRAELMSAKHKAILTQNIVNQQNLIAMKQYEKDRIVQKIRESKNLSSQDSLGTPDQVRRQRKNICEADIEKLLAQLKKMQEEMEAFNAVPGSDENEE